MSMTPEGTSMREELEGTWGPVCYNLAQCLPEGGLLHHGVFTVGIREEGSTKWTDVVAFDKAYIIYGHGLQGG